MNDELGGVTTSKFTTLFKHKTGSLLNQIHTKFAINLSLLPEPVIYIEHLTLTLKQYKKRNHKLSHLTIYLKVQWK